MRKSVRTLCGVLLAWLAPAAVWSAPIVDSAAIAPASGRVSVATTVVVTATITDPSVLPNGVILQRIDTAGRVIATLGVLHDDGADGDAAASDRIYSIQLTVFETAPGPVRYRVSAAFRGALVRAFSSPLTFNVTGSTPTGITILAPANLAYLNTSPVIVAGTVGDPNATVAVNGVNAPVGGNNFQLTVPLVEGNNTLTAVATNTEGTTNTTTIQVTLDTTPPRVTIESPPTGAITTDTSITVTGTINDIVVGTVNTEQAVVNVNGVPAQVANRSFNAANIPLSLGDNTIQVIGTDRAGNSTTASVLIRREAPTRPFVRVISGNNQSGPISTLLGAPLVAALDDGSGNPVANVPIVFRVTDNNGTVNNGGPALPSLAVMTNAAGQAQVNLALGSRAGAGSNRVEATAAGFEGVAAFTATGLPTTAEQINLDSGSGQAGALGEKLAFPFIAVVTDGGHNRISGVPVTFTVRQGGGSLAGASTQTMSSDPDGRVAAVLTLGNQPGFDNNVVEATFPGNPGLPAVFIASAKAPGDAADTRISGVVLDNSNAPIAGVTVRLFLTNQGTSNNTPQQVGTPVQTDAQGHFLMQPVPVGYFKLMADGTTVAPERGVFPTLEYDIVTVAGQENTVGMPIFLPVLDTANQLCVSETVGGTLTLPQVPGFSLTVAAGSATFPGGARSGCITVSMVNGDKVPMSPGFGQQPRFIVTIQPVGTLFNPPAPITMPNVDGLAPGQVTELYSYDHDLAAFTAIGTGTVTADGLLLRSDPGVGILKAGWHCGGDPNSSGSAASLSLSVAPTQVTKVANQTFTVVANGSPPLDGVYSWELVSTASGDDTGAASITSGPACANQQSCTATLRTVRQGHLTLRVHFRCTTTNAEVTRDVRINVVTVEIEVNSTPAEADDITALTPPQTIPARVTLRGGNATVTLSVSPASRGTLDRTSIAMTDGVPEIVTLTPAAVSAAANDAAIVATVDGAEAGREDLTIVNVTFPAIRAANTPAGVPDRIPPRVDTPINVTIAPDLAGSGQQVTLATLNTSGNNGNFTIGGAATFNVTTTGNVNFRGTAQTAATAAPGGGNAGNLRAVARVRGADAVQSNGFSVAAQPARMMESLSGLVSPATGRVGIIVSVTVESDSGVLADLDQVDFSEQVQVQSTTGVFAGVTSANSGYLPAVGTYTDTHSTPLSLLTGVGTASLTQTHIYRDRRLGVNDIPIPNSGYTINRTAFEDPPGSGTFRLTTTKAGAATTANGFSSSAGGTSGAITGTQP